MQAPKLTNDRPIFLQLYEHIGEEIASGRLAPGADIPPVRTLAEQLKINPITIQKAFWRLEEEGLIITGRTLQGRSVTSEREVISAYRQKLAEEHLKTCREHLESLGYTPEETEGLITKITKKEN